MVVLLLPRAPSTETAAFLTDSTVGRFLQIRSPSRNRARKRALSGASKMWLTLRTAGQSAEMTLTPVRVARQAGCHLRAGCGSRRWYTRTRGKVNKEGLNYAAPRE